MSLVEKLSSLTPETAVAELDQMLKGVHTRISWKGERLLSVEGYEGETCINNLANTYLMAKPFQDYSCDLQERLDCDALWDRVSQLYKDSDTELKTMLVYSKIVPLLEFRPYCRHCAGDPQILMQDDPLVSARDRLYCFSPDLYKAYFGEKEAIGYGSGPRGDYQMASREMVLQVENDQDLAES